MPPQPTSRPMAPQGRQPRRPPRTHPPRRYQPQRRMQFNRIATIRWWGRLLIQSLGLALTGQGLRMGPMVPPMVFIRQHPILRPHIPHIQRGTPGPFWTGRRLPFAPCQRLCLCPACRQRLGPQPHFHRGQSPMAAPASPSSTASRAALSKSTCPPPRTTLERLLDSATRLPKPLGQGRSLSISLNHLETRENRHLPANPAQALHLPSQGRTRLGHFYRLHMADSSTGPFSGLLPSWVTYPFELAFIYVRKVLDEALIIWQVHISPSLAQYSNFEIFCYSCYFLAYAILIGIFFLFFYHAMKHTSYFR